MLGAVKKLYTKFFVPNSVVQWRENEAYTETDDYNSLAKNGYVRNIFVYRCIDYTAENFSQIKWGIYKKDPNGNQVLIEKHPLNRIFSMPNPETTWEQFVYYASANIDLAGNAYFKKTFFGNKVEWLYNLTPNDVQIKTGKEFQSVNTYIFRRQGEELVLPQNEVIHWKTYNPLDEIFGLSRVRVASLTVDQNNYGKEWNAKLVQNSGKADAVFIGKGLGMENAKQFQRHIDDKYSGPDRAGKPLVLGGEWTYQNIAMSMRDADWIKAQQMSQGDICTVFGVPSMLVGDSNNKTYKNYAEARRAFWDERILPLACRLKGVLQINLKEGLAPGEFVGFDISEIPAFSQNETELVERLKSADWLTVNEKRERMSLLPQDGEEYNLPMVMLTGRVNHGDLDADGGLDSAGSAENAQTGNNTNKDPKSVKTPKKSDKPEPEIREKKISGSTTVIVERKRKKAEADFKQGISQIFAIEQNKVMDAIDKVADPSAILLMAEIAIKDNRSKWIDGLVANVAKVAYEFAILTGKMIKSSNNKFSTENGLEDERLLALALLLDFESLDLEDLGTVESATVSQNISTLIKQYVVNNEVSGSVDSIENTTIKRVQAVIAAAVLAGFGPEEIKESVDNLYLTFQDGRTRVIAETEVVKASNLGIVAAGISLGKTTKTWVTVGDNRVRTAHVLANGQAVGISENFSVGGELLEFPGDTSKGATADNVINCRCSIKLGETNES